MFQVIDFSKNNHFEVLKVHLHWCLAAVNFNSLFLVIAFHQNLSLKSELKLIRAPIAHLLMQIVLFKKMLMEFQKKASLTLRLCLRVAKCLQKGISTMIEYIE